MLVSGCGREAALTSVIPEPGNSGEAAAGKSAAPAKVSSVRLDQRVFERMVTSTDRHVAVALEPDRSIGLDVDSVVRAGSDVSIRGRVTGQNGVVFLSRTGGLLSGIVEIPGQGRTILMEQAGGRIVVTRFEGNTPLRCSFDGPADLGAVDCTAAGLSEIRVLVLYDDRVASGGGRQTLDQFIPALTLHANNILANSQIEAALRIVDIRPFDIVEQLRLIDDLALVTGSSGARAQDLLNEKRSANADIVVLVVSNATGDDGISNQLMPPFAQFGPFATAVVTLSSLMSSDVFMHEIGHTMGAGHQTGPGAFAWSRAKLRPSPELGTVMASGVLAMNTIPYFSNPNVLVPDSRTEKTGDATHDNARTLNATRGCVERFRTQ